MSAVFRPGLRLGDYVLVRRIRSAKGRWAAKCLGCDRVFLRFAAILAQRVRQGVRPICRSCAADRRRIPRHCVLCGTRSAKRFERGHASKCMACRQAEFRKARPES